MTDKEMMFRAVDIEWFEDRKVISGYVNNTSHYEITKESLFVHGFDIENKLECAFYNLKSKSHGHIGKFLDVDGARKYARQNLQRKILGSSGVEEVAQDD